MVSRYEPNTSSSVRSVKEQPENAPPGQLVAKSGVWLDVMVNRTNRTPVAPAVGATLLIRPSSADANVPLAAVVQVVPFGDVSIVKPPVDALAPSPQVADGSTPNAETSTAWGSLTRMCFGTKWFVGSPALSPVVV